MTLAITSALLIAFAAATVICGWLGARPPDLRRVRMAPWRFLMLLSAAGGLLMIVHLVNLLGVTTGR